MDTPRNTVSAKLKESKTPEKEVGYVLSTRNFLAVLDGLPTVKVNDIVVSESGVKGVVSGLMEDRIEVLLLDEGNILPGDLFVKAGVDLSIPIGDFLLGRAINPLGIPIDGRRPFATTKNVQKAALEFTAPGINARKFIKEQFTTGVMLVDTLIPLGRGQRELIIGDAHSGKTSFLLDVIVNQKEQETICIYTSIGKPIIQVRSLLDALTSTGALAHTIVIAASSSEPAPLIFLAPQAGFSVAEYFQKKGKNVLLILDDLGIHAKIYREIALLSDRSPGRESYPGDIFYQHAHLIERAGNFTDAYGGGSITALPVIEINLNDYTSFIPTNLMGMTDGHLMFKSNLNNQGQTPAIDIPLSVSRVGRQTQNRLQNLLSSKIRQILAQAEDLETIKRFSSELPFETRILLHQKEMISELIRQDSLTFVPLGIQLILLGLVFTNFLLERDLNFIKKNKLKLIEAFIKDKELSSLPKNVFKIETLEEFLTILESLGPKLVKICS